MEAIENGIITPIKDFLSGSALGSDLTLAICGVAAVVVLFLFSLIFWSLSSTQSFRKKLVFTEEYLKNSDEITEENVEGLNKELQKMPEDMQKGWGCFLEQKVGYPSDYITKKDVLQDKKFSGSSKAGKTFFGISSAVVIILTIWLMYMVSSGKSLTQVGLSDFTSNFEVVVAIIAALCAPLLVYIVLAAVLNFLYRVQYRKLEENFSAFQNALDNKVIIYSEEEDEFVSENIGEINLAIEEILANKLEDKAIVEVVTAPGTVAKKEEPKQEEKEETKEEAEQVKEPEQKEEPKKEDTDTPEQTPQETQARLQNLIDIIDQAVYEDKNVTKQQIEELALIINNEMENSFRDEKDKEALKECLVKLVNKYDSMP